MISLGRFRGVPIRMHWSVPAVCLFFVGANLQHPVTTICELLAYIGILLIHEGGHQLVARRRRHRVFSIELYPLHGTCRIDTPWSELDEAWIATGGVLAQFAVAIPIAIVDHFVGHTPYAAIDAVLKILSFVNVSIALFNLLPIGPLDGKVAWKLVPLLWRRAVAQRRRPQTALEALEDAVRKARRR